MEIPNFGIEYVKHRDYTFFSGHLEYQLFRLLHHRRTFLVLQLEETIPKLSSLFRRFYYIHRVSNATELV